MPVCTAFLGRFKGQRNISPKINHITTFGSAKFNTFYFDTSLKKAFINWNYSANMVNYRYKGEYTDYFNTQEDFKSIWRRFRNL